MKVKLFICLCLMALTAACSRENSKARHAEYAQWMENNGKVKVLSTIAMIHDVVKGVGGDHVDSISLIQGELDPHSYQLVKGDNEKLIRADLIFYNGLGLEHGASLQSYLSKNAKAIPLAEKVRKKQPEVILIEKGQVDPHIWMDISLWSEIIPDIVSQLSEKDPAHAAEFQKRGEILKAKMMKVHAELKKSLQQIPEQKRYLVTSHDAFNYFSRAYLASDAEVENGSWRKRFMAPEGLAPESQLSSRELQAIIDFVKQHQVNVLFPESNVSKDSIRKIIEAGKNKGLNLRIADKSLYGDAMKAAESDEDGYLNMMEYNVRTIINNWSQPVTNE